MQRHAAKKRLASIHIIAPPLMPLTSQPNFSKGGLGATSRCLAGDVVDFGYEAFDVFVFAAQHLCECVGGCRN